VNKNSSQLRNLCSGYEQHAGLLRNINDYWKQVQMHIIAVLQMLYAMGEDMEDLWKRAAAPELVNQWIPI
jgi:hypothetical protein